MENDNIRELIKKSKSIHKNIDNIINKENEIIKSIENKYIQKDFIKSYCEDNIKDISKKINNLKSVNKRSPLLEFYRGKLQAYKNIINMLEG